MGKIKLKDIISMTHEYEEIGIYDNKTKKFILEGFWGSKEFDFSKIQDCEVTHVSVAGDCSLIIDINTDKENE